MCSHTKTISNHRKEERGRKGRHRGATEIYAAHCLQILIAGWTSSPNLNPLYLCVTSLWNFAVFLGPQLLSTFRLRSSHSFEFHACWNHSYLGKREHQCTRNAWKTWIMIRASVQCYNLFVNLGIIIIFIIHNFRVIIYENAARLDQLWKSYLFPGWWPSSFDSFWNMLRYTRKWTTRILFYRQKNILTL